ncbi:MAG: hypothetical protein U0271_40145 [Polyangiaceae bacterium]
MSALTAALALGATACGSRPRRVERPTVDSEPSQAVDTPRTKKGKVRLSDKDVEDVVAIVSKARGLPIKHPLKIEWLEQAAFKKQVEATAQPSPDDDSKLSGEDAAMLGFDFLPPPSARTSVASTTQILGEEVSGFYDPAADKIVIPKLDLSDDRLFDKPDPGVTQLDIQRAILAHEIHHALQAQNFGVDRFKAANSDEAIAQLSLLEGDAQVAMGAYLGARAGVPLGRTLRRMRETVKAVPLESLSKHTEKESALSRALPLTRERLAFPYVDGMLFVSDIFRAGGLELVDQAYARPPRTTEQILHPEKYLADEQPIEFAAFDPPKPLASLGADSLGELQTRILLERCVGHDAAVRAAEGWAGDRYFIVSEKDQLGTAWITAWDSTNDAEDAAHALEQGSACFSQNSVKGYSIGAETTVERRGTAVAFVRGLDADKRKKLTAALLKLPKQAPKPVVISSLTIPPRVALPEPVKGKVEDGIYRNEWLRLAGRIPKGMRAIVDRDQIEVIIERKNTPVFGAFYVSQRMTTDALNEETFETIRRVFASELKKKSLKLKEAGGGAVETTMGNAVDKRWKVKDTSIVLRAVLVPICAGTGSLVFVQIYGDDQSKRVVDGWLDSFKFGGGRDLPACDYLDPK